MAEPSVRVEARRLPPCRPTGEVLEGLADWCGGYLEVDDDPSVYIQTLEGTVTVRPGDWIVIITRIGDAGSERSSADWLLERARAYDGDGFRQRGAVTQLREDGLNRVQCRAIADELRQCARELRRAA